MRSAIFLSLAVLAAALTASAAASSFCDTADDKPLCDELVGAAKTWDEAMTNALNGAMKKTEAGKTVADTVAAKLPADLKPVTKDSLVSTCHDAYDGIMDNLKECIGYVKDDPNASLRVHLSAVSYSDCTDGLTEFGVTVAEATQFDEEIHKVADSLLAVSDKKPA